MTMKSHTGSLVPLRLLRIEAIAVLTSEAGERWQANGSLARPCPWMRLARRGTRGRSCMSGHGGNRLGALSSGWVYSCVL